jgi:hypothetical protein
MNYTNSNSFEFYAFHTIFTPILKIEIAKNLVIFDMIILKISEISLKIAFQI